MTQGARPSHVLSVTAITEVQCDGQKLTGVALEYDKQLQNAEIVASAFVIPGRSVLRAYTTDRPAPRKDGRDGKDGRYVIVELDSSDEGAALCVRRDRAVELLEAHVSVAQSGEVVTVQGETYPPDPTLRANDRVVNVVVDDFEQFEYTHPSTGIVLQCNLFVPRDHDPARSYPLLTFVHDLGCISTDPGPPWPRVLEQSSGRHRKSGPSTRASSWRLSTILR